MIYSVYLNCMRWEGSKVGSTWDLTSSWLRKYPRFSPIYFGHTTGCRRNPFYLFSMQRKAQQLCNLFSPSLRKDLSYSSFWCRELCSCLWLNIPSSLLMDTALKGEKQFNMRFTFVLFWALCILINFRS